MLDTTNFLIHKLSLQIFRPMQFEDNTTVFDAVKYILLERICETFHLQIEWDTFSRGGKFRSASGAANIQIASLSSDIRTLWAIRIQVRDANMVKRQWSYQIGIRVFDGEHLQLCYAKCCYDHTAGSIQTPRPIPMVLDRFPDPLFFNEDIQCMCGEHPLPVEPVELCDSTVSDFVALLQDPQRPYPILLITCADVLAPEEAADVMLGNAVVYWCANASVMMRLNTLLPEDLSTPWDSVRVFLPVNSDHPYHPYWFYDDIRRMGENAFLSGLHQAYCASMRSQERRDFLTIEDVYRYRDHMHITELTSQIEKQKAESSRLSSLSEKQYAEIAGLREQLQALQKSTSTVQLSEYESLLNETMAESDALKKGIASLSERLYSSLGTGFTPDEAEKIEVLQELSQAIYASIACAGSKRK